MSDKSTSDSPLTNVALGIEERRCNLIGRHQYLRNKIAAMEQSIPALIAYNMWMVDDQDRRDTPCHMLREIVNQFSQLDPVDGLVAELKSTVNDLNQETAQLHDKIIDADMKLEEITMELESLELANKEMEGKLIGLRNETRRHSTLSLHSIHSEDLMCLRKIRQLAEKELNMKNYMKKLKDKETIYKRQISQLLRCKKSRDSKRITGAIQKTRRNDRELCRVKISKYNLEKIKKQYTSKDKKRGLHGSKCLPFLYCTSLNVPCASANYKTPDGCRAACKFCQSPTATSTFKSVSPCAINPDCESVLSATSKTDISRPFRQSMHLPVPCDPGKTCDTCNTTAACKLMNTYRCSCEKKCTYELSTALYNYSVTSMTDMDKVVHQSSVLKVPRSGSESEDSDEEFCECCTCGEDSENS